LRRRSIISAREAEAGGIPIFWADLPTRFVVGLAVRVGRCDESLANGGVTHLVEHLAVPTDVPGSVDVNGAVSDAVSFFWASGPEQLALDAKGRIAENLADPPLARLGPSTAELERQVDIVLIELADPEEAASFLSERARNGVLRTPPLTEKELLAELETVTPEMAANALREALETELLLVPFGTRPGRDGLKSVSLRVADAGRGTPLPPVRPARAARRLAGSRRRRRHRDHRKRAGDRAVLGLRGAPHLGRRTAVPLGPRRVPDRARSR
jgi:hypothetical protein